MHGEFTGDVAPDGTTAVAHSVGAIPNHVSIWNTKSPEGHAVVLSGAPTPEQFTVRMMDLDTNRWVKGTCTASFEWAANT
jgi:hypothetical protein